ncbi:LOW QUALITY PROTEIN: hypothetical protein V1477_017759 [Vespula maculifrons]|uniref:Uncharacterized protein n=1 Tax=Vespula maculifrons TaxID=7453 RepID=A0ABD2B0D5_VESMC
MKRGALSNDSGPAFPGSDFSNLDKKICACRARRAPCSDSGSAFVGAILSERKIAPIPQILIKKLWACRARRALSNDPSLVFPDTILSEKKIVKEKFFFHLFPSNRYNSAPIVQILIKKIWACRTRRALSNGSGAALPGAILSEKKIVKEKFFFPLFPLNRYNKAPVACSARRALSNDPGPVFLDAILSEKKIVREQFYFPLLPINRYNSAPIGHAILSEKKIVKEKFFFHLFPSNRYNSAPIIQILIKKILACRARRALSNDPGPVFLGLIVSEKKIVKEKFCLPLFPLNRYNSAPILQISIKKIWACRARRALSSDPGPVFLGATVSEKKIVKEKILSSFVPLKPARRSLSSDPGPVFLRAIVSEKKIKKFFLPLFPLNRYNSAPTGQILIKKIWSCRARRALSSDPSPVFLGARVSEKKIKKFCLPLFPLNRYNSAPIGQILIKKIWACRARRALSNDPGPVFLGAIVSEKKIKKFCLPMFPLNRYNSAPIGQILIKKIWACRARRALSNDPGPVLYYNSVPIGQILMKKIWACRRRRALSNDCGPALPGAILSEKKIVKEKFFFPLFPLNSYNKAPVGQIFIEKIWACSARRALSNDSGPAFKNFFSFVPFEPLELGSYWSDLEIKNMGMARRALSNELGPVFLEAILSEKKIVKEKFFFHLFPSNRYNSASVGQIFIEKIWACSARRALSNDSGPALPDAILSEKKINSAPIGQILIKKICPCRARRALSNDPGPVFLRAIVSEKKIKKFCLPLFPLNRYNSAPIAQILIKKIWACSARRALSNDPGPVFLGAIVSEKKIKKFFFHLFPLNRYNSASVGQIFIEKIWACSARRALSNDSGPALPDSILSEKKIVKEKFFFHLFPSNRYNSAPIIQILIKKILACRARRALSNDPGPVFLGLIVSEKKIVKEKFCLPLFPLNRYNSAPILQILIKKIWACRARRALSSDPGPVFLGATVSEKKIVKEKILSSFVPLKPARRSLSSDPGPVFLRAIVSEKKIKKFFLPLFPLNRYNSAPTGQILIKKIWSCRARRALSSDPSPVFLGARVSEKKIKKFCLPLFPLNRYNSAPIGQILIKKIWACRARRALSNDPGPVFLGAIVSEKKIKKFCLPMFPLNRYNSAPIGQILIKKIWACRARRALSNDPGPVLYYNSVPIGQILMKKIWACRRRRALSNDCGPALPGAILSEKKIVKEKFFFPLFPLNSYNKAPVGQIFIEKIWACSARRALSNDSGPAFKNFFSFVPFEPLELGSYWSDLEIKNMGMARRALSNELGPVFLEAILSEKKIVKEKFFFHLFPSNRYNSASVGQIFIEKIWACSARRALSNDSGPALPDAILSEKKINSAPIGQILIKKICPCRARRALSNDPGPVFLRAIVSEKKIKKFCLPLFPLNRYNSAPIAQILIKKIWACRARRALSNDPGPVFLGAIVSEKKIKKFFFHLFPLNRYNSASVGQIFIEKIWACSARRALSNDSGPALPDSILSEKKINSAPIGQILIKKICACRARRALSNDPGPVFLRAIVSEKKIKKFCLPLFPLNRYNSVPIAQILIKKIWACRARRALSNDPGPVFLGAIVSEKKIVKEKILSSFVPFKPARRALSNDPGPVFLGAIVSEKKIKKFCLPLFPLNRYNSAPILQILIKKIWAWREEPFPVTPVRFFLVLYYNSVPIGQILMKKIWACRRRRALSNDCGPALPGAILSEKKIVKGKFFFPLFLLNRYNTAPVGQILIKKIWACSARRSFPMARYNSVPIGQILMKKIWACRRRRALSNDCGPALPGAILSEKKIVKGKFFFPLFLLNRYNTAPVGQILIKKIWACRPRISHSNDPGMVFLGAIVSEKKIVKEKFFFHLFISTRYNSAPIVQILIRKIWPCRPRRSLSSDPGPVFLDLDKKICACRARRAPGSDSGSAFVGAILSERKIAPIPQILIKKLWACRARRALSNDPGLVFPDTILSEKKIVKEKFFFHLFPSNRYNSAPIVQILIKKIWACRTRRALSNGSGAALPGAILSEKKIVKEKFFFPLFPLNRYNSAPVGQILIEKIWACSARRPLSNDPGPAFLGSIVSEEKIVKEKFFFRLFPLIHYNSAPIGQILNARRSLSNGPVGFPRCYTVGEKNWREEPFPTTPVRFFLVLYYNSVPIGQILMKKIWACRRRRALSNDCGPALPGAILSEKKIVKGKFFFPLFLLNRYNTAPVGQILIKKIWACSARRSFPMARYNSVPIGQILMKKIWACRRRRALSNDCGPALPGAILSEKKIVKGKFFFPLFLLNRYNTAPVGQILIKKIWACRPRISHSNDPGMVFLGAIVSEKKIVKEKFFFHLFISTRYNSAPIVQILIKKIWACMTRRALSNDSGPAFPGAILSEKKIVKGKFFFPLFPLNRYNSAPVGQFLIKKIWACRARRALSNDPGPVFLDATLSEKKINSAPIGQILIGKIWPCRPRRSLSSDPGPVFLGAIGAKSPFQWPGRVFLDAIVSEKKIVKEKFLLL